MAEDAISKAKKVKDGIKKKSPAKKKSEAAPKKKEKENKPKFQVNPPRENPYRLEADNTSKETGKKIPFPGKTVESKTPSARPPIKYPGAGPDADAIISGRLLDASAGPVGRIPWDKPDKEMYRGRFFAPEDLDFKRPPMGRRPESLGLPPVPQGNAIPQGKPDDIFKPETLQKYQSGVPSQGGMSLPDERISQPPAGAPPRTQAGMPAQEPNWNFLDKFREGVSPAAGGAANWDPAYNPESRVPSWIKDEEASAFEDRRATNAAKEDWWADQTPDQMKANLVEAAKAQGDAGMRNVDPSAWKQRLMQRRNK